MKNISLIINVVLLAAIAHLYYLNSKKSSPDTQVIQPTGDQKSGVHIAYVNADTLDAKYEWLKNQKSAIEDRIEKAQNSLGSEQEALMKDAAALQERYAQGNMTQAEAEKEQASLQQRGQRLQEKEGRLAKSLADEQKKAMDELYANLEAKLKQISNQIGYDYILSYQRGGAIMLASDSLDITKQVLDLLNAKEQKQ